MFLEDKAFGEPYGEAPRRRLASWTDAAWTAGLALVYLALSLFTLKHTILGALVFLAAFLFATNTSLTFLVEWLEGRIAARMPGDDPPGIL